MKMNLQSNLAGFIDESSNRPGCSAVAGLAVRQLDIYIYIYIIYIYIYDMYIYIYIEREREICVCFMSLEHNVGTFHRHADLIESYYLK